MMSVWDAVIGQPRAVEALERAVAAAHGHAASATAMTHAWLITGPPGSGRSVAAAAFAAALVCPREGCGECPACVEVRAGTHPDVELVRSTTLSHSKQLSSELVLKAADAPVLGGYRCLVLEDADRMTDAAANALLKAIEEPTATTVWILCAPSPEDLLATIRSRVRHIALRVPESRAVADVLVAEGVDRAMAEFAAQAAQGHIGRARGLATDAEVRSRRSMVLTIPSKLQTLGDCYAMAHKLKAAAEADSSQRLGEHLAHDREQTMAAFGEGAAGVSNRKVKEYAKSSLAELERVHKQQSSRSVRDELDRYFTDLLGYYRDVLALQCQAEVTLINADLRASLERHAANDPASQTMQRISALGRAREQLEANVPPALVCEALLVQLLHPSGN